MSKQLEIIYDDYEKEILVYKDDLVLVCTGIELEDTEAILVEGDYYTPDDYVGGETAQEKAENYYYRYPEKFELC